jgi:hypothetical protein
VIAAINAGRVPPAFQEQLQARSNELVNSVNCAPSTDTGESNDEQSKQDKKEKKKDKQQSDEETVTIPTEPLPTVTEDEP